MFSALVENVTGLKFVPMDVVTKWQGSRLPDPTPVGAKGTSHKRDDYSIKRTKEGWGFFPLKVLGPGPLLAPHPPMPGEAWAPGLSGHPFWGLFGLLRTWRLRALD